MAASLGSLTVVHWGSIAVHQMAAAMVAHTAEYLALKLDQLMVTLLAFVKVLD